MSRRSSGFAAGSTTPTGPLMANDWAERALVVGVSLHGVRSRRRARRHEGAPAPGTPESSAVATVAQLVSTLAGGRPRRVGILRLHASHADAYDGSCGGSGVDPRHPGVHLLQLQLAGLGGLAIDLVAYGSLRFALAHELADAAERAGG